MIAYSEIDPYCCRVLRANTARGWLPQVVAWLARGMIEEAYTE